MKSSFSNILRILLGIWIAAVLVAVFLLLPSYEGLGNAGRIMVLHVPTAWVSVLAFAMSAWFSARYLWKGHIGDDDRALAAAESGFLFTILATGTGMIFSQVVWGIFWNWDPRQTSIFVLLLIYAALFALRSAIDHIEQRRRLSAVYAIFAFITVPFLVFIVPRLSDTTLHPNCTFLPGSKCDGLHLNVGHIGLLGDRKVQLLELRQDATIVTAQVKISEPGLKSETIVAPTFDLATGNPVQSPDIPGGDHFRLAIEAVDMQQQQAHINIQAPGSGILNNQRTLLTFLASIVGFTGLFAWLFALRVSLLAVQWELAKREGGRML
jgi:heme exporter protein C